MRGVVAVVVVAAFDAGVGFAEVTDGAVVSDEALHALVLFGLRSAFADRLSESAAGVVLVVAWDAEV